MKLCANYLYLIGILETIKLSKLFVLDRNIWNHITVSKLFVLDRNTWSHVTGCKLFVLDWNTWNHKIMCKLMIIDKKMYDKKIMQWNIKNLVISIYICDIIVTEFQLQLGFYKFTFKLICWIIYQPSYSSQLLVA